MGLFDNIKLITDNYKREMKGVQQISKVDPQ